MKNYTWQGCFSFLPHERTYYCSVGLFLFFGCSFFCPHFIGSKLPKNMKKNVKMYLSKNLFFQKKKATTLRAFFRTYWTGMQRNPSTFRFPALLQSGRKRWKTTSTLRRWKQLVLCTRTTTVHIARNPESRRTNNRIVCAFRFNRYFYISKYSSTRRHPAPSTIKKCQCQFFLFLSFFFVCTFSSLLPVYEEGFTLTQLQQ